MSNDSKTCEQLAGTIYDPSVFSPGDSPAKMSAPLARAAALVVLEAACGMNSRESLPSSGPLSLSLKTSHREQLDTLTRSETTWNGKAMQRFRRQSRRRIAALGIFGAVFSLSESTPTGERLTTRDGLLPTPAASEHGSNKGGTGGREGHPERLSIPAMARRNLWPTPTTRDHKDTGLNTNYEALKKRRVLAGAIGGPLNPPWIEWLMGFPTGWTDLRHSGMQLCPNALKSSEKSSSCYSKSAPTMAAMLADMERHKRC